MGARVKDVKDCEGSSVSTVYARARVTAISRTRFTILHWRQTQQGRNTITTAPRRCFHRPQRYPATAFVRPQLNRLATRSDKPLALQCITRV